MAKREIKKQPKRTIEPIKPVREREVPVPKEPVKTPEKTPA